MSSIVASGPRVRQRLLFTTAVVGGCALLLWQAGTSSIFLAGTALGGLVVARWPILGVLFFSITIPVENLLMFGGATLTRLLGMGVFAGWVVHKIVFRQSWKALFDNHLFAPAALLIAFVALSLLWADEQRVVVVGTIQLLQLFALALLMVDVLDGWRKAEWLVRMLVVGALIAATITLFQYYGLQARRAGADVGGGVNATAATLVTLLPFSFYLLRSSQPALWRGMGVVALVASVGGILVTFSRMSFLLLPLLLVSQGWETFRGRRGAGWLTAVALVVGLTAAARVPWGQIESRASTILPYLATSVTGSETGGVVESSGRGYHLRVGLEIFADHPVLGVGYGNYGERFVREYQFQVEGTGGKLYRGARSPHSSNIGILADLGAVGFALWFLLMAAGAFSVGRAWRSMRRLADRGDGFFLVQAVAYAYAVQVLAYTWYTPNQKEKLFWCLLALTIVVCRLAVRAEAEGSARRLAAT